MVGVSSFNFNFYNFRDGDPITPTPMSFPKTWGMSQHVPMPVSPLLCLLSMYACIATLFYGYGGPSI